LECVDIFNPGPDVGEIDIYVDAFNSGEILFPQDCEALLQIYQEPRVCDLIYLRASAIVNFSSAIGNLKGVGD
jgi:hypothetical protein